MKLSPIGQSTKLQKFSRRRVFALFIAIVVLIIGVFVLWSNFTWDSYQTNYEGWRNNTLNQIRVGLALPVNNDQERQAKFVAFKQISNSITDTKRSLCTVNQLIGWQQFIEMQHNRAKACQTIVGDFATFSEKLNTATAYLESEQMLARLIGDAPAKAELFEGDWRGVSAGWHALVDKVDMINTDESFNVTKQTARDAIGKIDTGWQALLAAHAAKDKARYLQAQSQLVQAYSTLGAIADVDSAQLKALLDSLQIAYDAIYDDASLK